MHRFLLVSLAAALLSGCASPSVDPPATASAETLPPARPGPVDLNETFDLTQGGQKTWGFQVAADAVSADIRFVLIPLAGAPAAVGMPVCFRYETPGGADSMGQCVGPCTACIQVAPAFTIERRVFFELHDVHPGSYSFSIDGQQNPVELHAYAKVVQ